MLAEHAFERLGTHLSRKVGVLKFPVLTVFPYPEVVDRSWRIVNLQALNISLKVRELVADDPGANRGIARKVPSRNAEEHAKLRTSRLVT